LNTTGHSDDGPVATLSWGDEVTVETGNTTLAVAFVRSETVERFHADELGSGYEGPVDPEPGRVFVVATVDLTNTGNHTLRVARSQWSLVDGAGTVHTPHYEAMRMVAGTVPADARLSPGSAASYRVIVAVDRDLTDDAVFLLDPGVGAPTVRLDPPG
jgi:hypothetical protein